MNNITFSPKGWEDYTYWQSQDKKTLKRINKLIEDICRNGLNSGLGKTEPLRNELSGFFSKRIDEKNRLVFRIKDDCIEIVQCRSHYSNK